MADGEGEVCRRNTLPLSAIAPFVGSPLVKVSSACKLANRGLSG